MRPAVRMGSGVRTVAKNVVALTVLHVTLLRELVFVLGDGQVRLAIYLADMGFMGKVVSKDVPICLALTVSFISYSCVQIMIMS